MSDELNEFFEEVVRNEKRFENYLVYTTRLLEGYGSRLESLNVNGAQRLAELREIHKNYPDLIEIINKSFKLLQLIFPPVRVAELSANIDDEQITFGSKQIDLDLLLSVEEASSLMKDVQEFIHPTPEFLKKLLTVWSPDSFFAELSKKFFENLGDATKKKTNITRQLFQDAIKELTRSMYRSDTFRETRYLQQLLGAPQTLTAHIKALARRTELLLKLSNKQRNFVSGETVGIAYDLLEHSVKTLLDVTYRLKRVSEGKRPPSKHPKTIGQYLNSLGINIKKFRDFRNIIAHQTWELRFDEKLKEYFVVFSPKSEYNLQSSETPKRMKLDGFLSLILTLNAHFFIYKEFMESYVNSSTSGEDKEI